MLEIIVFRSKFVCFFKKNGDKFPKNKISPESSILVNSYRITYLLVMVLQRTVPFLF